MANTPKIGLKIPSTADNIAEQINIDTPNNLDIIDTEIDGVKTQINDLVAQPAMLEPTLLNGWVGAFSTVAKAWKDAFGNVFIEGVIAEGTTTSGTVLFTLPVGYRPTRFKAFACNSNNEFTSVQVATNGSVSIRGTTSAQWLALDGISFRLGVS